LLHGLKVKFQDDTHATGTCYALAHLVNEKEETDHLTVHGVRYFDKYVKQEGCWLIAEREQYFVFSNTGAIGK
jgi:hypothetical protein